MKRKAFIIVPIAVMAALVILVSPLKSFAYDAMSIFRVNDVQTIEITAADMQEAMTTMEALGTELQGKQIEYKPLVNIVSSTEPSMKKLENSEDFTSFDFDLPLDLKSETPEIVMADSYKTVFTLNVDACNEALALIGSDQNLSSDLAGVEMTMTSSPAVIASYDELLYFATQQSVLDAPEDVKTELRSTILDLPIIPTNIRAQLKEIDPASNDIYLPVLSGFGREVDLGGMSGYVYTLSDLKSLYEGLPADLKASEPHPTAESLTPEQKAEYEAKQAEANQAMVDQYGVEKVAAMNEAHAEVTQRLAAMENPSLLVWTENGVLNGLIADKSDAELTDIARSVR